MPDRVLIAGAKARAVPARPKSVASHRKGGIERDLWIGWAEPACGEDWKCQGGSAAMPARRQLLQVRARGRRWRAVLKQSHGQCVHGC
jgi:hypothetical protein